ncbi:MAG: response regulator transcription factor [Bacteroidota bacterium]
MIKIALVDDHVVLRKSLGVLINKLEDFTIVFEADNGRHLGEQLKTQPVPDIILLDVTMPLFDGIETANWLKQKYPQIKILALSMLNSELVVIRMLKNGVRGYILKDCEPAELFTALHKVHDQGYYYNDLVTPKMNFRNLPPDLVILNSQELSFLRWTCTELTHKQIADEMQVSPRTVDGYRDSLFRKLEVNSRVGLVVYAIKNGFVSI